MNNSQHYVTPEEAEKMGCCMSMNRPEFAASCIGKTCMAWRWVNLIREVKDQDDCVIREGLFSTTHGYCGMVRND